MTFTVIKDTQARLDAVETLLTAQMPTRFIKRSLLHYTEQDNAELTAGILTIVKASEDNYKNQRGMVTKEATTQMLLIGHLHVAETTTSQAIETAELAFEKELKAAIETGITGLSFTLERIESSRQLEHPYGWFVAFVNIGPPRTSTH